jgi:CDP-diacylglycerol---glycerol-3-phosphate 3-phosphatidyltransferase
VLSVWRNFFIFDTVKRVPNILSASRIVLAPLFFYLYLHDSVIWAALGMAVFIFAAITDYLDGYYARRYDVSSSMGKFLDPLADKILTFAGFICLPFIDAGQFPWWIIGVIVFRDVFVTGMRVRADQTGMSMQTLYSAKVKTLVQMVFLYLALLVGILVKADGAIGGLSRTLLESGLLGWLFLVVMIVTVYTGLEYIWINRRLFARESEKI